MVRARGEKLRVIEIFPSLYAAVFGLVAEQHEGRGTGRMDDIAPAARETINVALVMRQDVVKLGFIAALDVEIERDHSDAVRQQADDLLGCAGAHCRHDHSSIAAPT